MPPENVSLAIEHAKSRVLCPKCESPAGECSKVHDGIAGRRPCARDLTPPIQPGEYWSHVGAMRIIAAACIKRPPICRPGHREQTARLGLTRVRGVQERKVFA